MNTLQRYLIVLKHCDGCKHLKKTKNNGENSIFCDAQATRHYSDAGLYFNIQDEKYFRKWSSYAFSHCIRGNPD